MGCTPIRHTAQVHRAKAARLPEPAQIVILLLFSMLHPSFPMYRLSPGFILREGRKKAKNLPVTWGIRFVSPAFYQHDALDDQKKKGKYCRIWLETCHKNQGGSSAETQGYPVPQPEPQGMGYSLERQSQHAPQHQSGKDAQVCTLHIRGDSDQGQQGHLPDWFASSSWVMPRCFRSSCNFS